MILRIGKIGVLLAMIMTYSFDAQAQSSQDSNPNVVIILADDLGYGDVSAFNEEAVFSTPHIDQLADQGVRFTDAHTTSAVCTPTRYGLLTGRYNWRSDLKSGVLSGYSKSLIEKERMTLADLLRDQDYETAFVGKWHLGWNWHFENETDPENLNSLSINPKVDFSKPIEMGPKDHGFSYSYGFSGSLDMPPYVYVENNQPTTTLIDSTVNYDGKGFWRKGPTGSDFRHADVLQHLTDKSKQFISKRADSDKAFMLYFALPAPHTPILPTTEFIGSSNTNLYGDFVLQVDDVVGQVTEALESEGLLDETIIIFTSDNGVSPAADLDELERAGHHSSYIYRGHKADIYEGGHRVPFIVHWPDGIPEGFTTDETISTVDIMATLADLLGTSLDDNTAEDSYSFLPVLEQKTFEQPLREAIVFHSISGRFAIRKGEWKLILWPGSGGWSSPNTEEEMAVLPDYQLYNLEVDPSEEHNVVDQHPQKVEELKSLLEKYIRDGRSTPGEAQQNDGSERWTQLEWMN